MSSLNLLHNHVSQQTLRLETLYLQCPARPKRLSTAEGQPSLMQRLTNVIVDQFPTLGRLELRSIPRRVFDSLAGQEQTRLQSLSIETDLSYTAVQTPESLPNFSALILAHFSHSA